MKSLYTERKLSEGYPNLEELGIEYYSGTQSPHAYTVAVMNCVEKLIDVTKGPKTVLIVGCGPKPYAIKDLFAKGYDVIGLEAIPTYVDSARIFLGNSARVELGKSESIPLEDNSTRIVFMENLLEHVDSPSKTLEEAYRILLSGGVLYISTSNRWKFSLTGKNLEFRVRFYNWFPPMVKESYVFQHLHYEPTLANYTPRPAVHWFSYSELCKLGRYAGFAQFYSWLDLVDFDSPFVAKSRFRRFLLNKVRFNPCLRAIALTQAGGSIFMFKRS